MIKKLTSLLLLLITAIFSQTDLSSFIGNQTLTKDEGSPYIIDTILTINENQTVTIKSGCQLFFAPSSGIIVEGSLWVEGTNEQPVLFSSKYDSLSPELSQQVINDSTIWQGITFTGKAGEVKLSHCILRYSHSGITSEKPDIVLDSVAFSSNNHHLSINKTRMEVKDTQPYTYPFCLKFDPNGAEKGSPPQDHNKYITGTTAHLPGNTNAMKKRLYEFTGWNLQPDKNGRHFAPFDTLTITASNIQLFAQWDNVLIRKGIPISIGCAGLVAGGVAICAYQQWDDNKHKFSNEPDPARQDYLNKKGEKSSFTSILCGTLAGVAVPFSVVLYLRNHLFH